MRLFSLLSLEMCLCATRKKEFRFGINLHKEFHLKEEIYFGERRRRRNESNYSWKMSPEDEAAAKDQWETFLGFVFCRFRFFRYRKRRELSDLEDYMTMSLKRSSKRYSMRHQSMSHLSYFNCCRFDFSFIGLIKAKLFTRYVVKVCRICSQIFSHDWCASDGFPTATLHHELLRAQHVDVHKGIKGSEPETIETANCQECVVNEVMIPTTVELVLATEDEVDTQWKGHFY